jgi:hypothetical protein
MATPSTQLEFQNKITLNSIDIKTFDEYINVIVNLLGLEQTTADRIKPLINQINIKLLFKHKLN